MSGIKYKFSGHQTFVFRYGWLEKGVRLVQQNPHGFLDDDALIKLGVGKNMVESIKYWCAQTGLLRDAGNGNMELTELGEFIFGKDDFENGCDPYLEDDATLWLLHWSLMQRAMPPEQTWSSWQLAFFRWHKPEFTKQELILAIRSWIANQCRVTTSTLDRDIDCFVRNYAGTRGKSGDENFDSPFLSLELIQGTSQADLFRFNIGAKKNLPTEIVGYAVLLFMKDRASVNVQNCLYDAGSPGQIFKLNEGIFMDHMQELEKISNETLRVSETAGLVSISYNGEKIPPSAYAKKLLEQYYMRGVK